MPLAVELWSPNHRISREVQVFLKKHYLEFPGGPVVKNSFVNARDRGLIAGLERSHMLWGD